MAQLCSNYKSLGKNMKQSYLSNIFCPFDMHT